MLNVRLDLAYDGTSYNGFQLQKEGLPTIQGRVEEGLARLYKQQVRLAGAGRTDAGVHARGQVATYQAPFEIPFDRLPPALNSVLPPDIVVHGAALVPPEFHARFSAKSKIYSYTIDRAAYPRVQLRLYSWYLPGSLDIETLTAAARVFEGSHDFKFFQAQGSTVRSTLRTIYRVRVEMRSCDQLLRLIFEGDGFLYKMVRLIVGSLVRVGQGRLNSGELAAALAGRQPVAAGSAAPAHGLCLEQVIY